MNFTLDDFDYALPEERIAQRPLADRAASKLLWLDRRSGAVRHHTFRDVLEILAPGDLLVMNDTRVTAVRLFGQRPTGAAVELLLLREEAPRTFEVLAKPGKRLKPGAVVDFEGGLQAEVTADLEDGRKRVVFAEVEGFDERLRAVGTVPLPPYVREKLADGERYQTVYAKTGGSAAAPTAGLHFTPELLEALRTRGVGIATVTLDVGIDTFRPVTSDNPALHRIHGERCEVGEATAEAVRICRGRVVAVGTTSVRTLESFAVGPREVVPGSKVSELYILPGYAFRVIDGMFTNFHMPRTTMLFMISALASRDAIMGAYAEALAHDYRFLSFGDSMLIL